MRHARQFAAFMFAIVTCASASATVVATNNDYSVVDGREVTRSLNVTERGTIRDVNISVEFSKCDDPPIGPNGVACRGAGTPFNDEFTIVLIAPDGREVTLVAPFETYSVGRVGPGREFVVFDDEAARAAGPNIELGLFRPAEMLSLFDGMNLYGRWTLYLQDFIPGDPLEFYSASLDIDFEPAPVPEPATLAMLGLGLAGMGAARRRRG
ncbi:PEP-CTERM sorting domain-containing protein [Massilia suwonensis]|uniref:PEP-CTERM sorting domain-containing protein n=1 Tax=Massilia suwonensis TaxID=648895 RepID=A0ABW0MQ88_9BURK